MSDKNLQFPIPNSVLEPYIKQAVSTAIIAALGSGTELVEKAVVAALSVKVNERGKVDEYRSRNEYNLTDIILSNQIREIAEETIKELVNEMKPQIKKGIENSLKNQSKLLANIMTEAFTKSLHCCWNVKINIDD